MLSKPFLLGLGQVLCAGGEMRRSDKLETERSLCGKRPKGPVGVLSWP